MEIQFFGHAALGIKSLKGDRLLIDPFRSDGFGGKIRYRPIEGDWDWVVVTHDHDDHNAVDTLKGPLNADPLALKERYNLRRIPIAHDEYEGQKFGGEVDIVCLEVDGLRICHLSDTGCAPSSSIVNQIGQVDLCFLPIGGFYTIGPLQAKAWWRALSPVVTVPIHYKTPSIDLVLENLENFLDYFDPEMIQHAESFRISERSDLAKYADIVVLDAINQK